MSSRTPYERFTDEDGENVGMISSSAKAAPPEKYTHESTKTPVWKIVAAVVAFVALLIPAVGYTSSVLLEYRVAQAVQQAQTTQQPSTTTAPVKLEEHPVQTISNPSASSTPFATTYEYRDCGSNADEARAKGCEYDVMMQEWQPPECIDWALSERFLKQGNWTWYANAEASKIYNDTEIALGNHDRVYVEQSYHRHHCIFAWERFVRALRTGRPLIEKMIDYDHVMHCKMNTLRTFEEGAQPVRGVVAPTAFTSCASYDVWLKRLPKNKHSSVERMVKAAMMEEWSD